MTMCIYHSNCADGFGAAWVVRKALGDKVEFHAASYQTDPPDVSGKEVIMVDFSYKRDVIIGMSKQAKSILIIDHHKTAQEDLVSLPSNVTVIFDIGRSGAMLTWDHFFRYETPPTLLLHIEDRDLWKFSMKNTREIMSFVFSYPFDFCIWDQLINSDSSLLAYEGAAIERKHLKDVLSLVELTLREITIGGHIVFAANIPPTFASDAGNIICKRDPKRKFAATYYDTKDGRVFSLRSIEGGADVSEIAKQYGGGGHKNAAGFKVSFAEARDLEF